MIAALLHTAQFLLDRLDRPLLPSEQLGKLQHDVTLLGGHRPVGFEQTPFAEGGRLAGRHRFVIVGRGELGHVLSAGVTAGSVAHVKHGVRSGVVILSSHHAKPGNGLLLFFLVDNFEATLPRARALVSRLEEEPHVNPNTGAMEFSLRDPNGYFVTISALNPA